MGDFSTISDADIADLHAYIAQTGHAPMPGIDEPFLKLAMQAATSAIQTACNRTFEETTASAARTFTYRRSWSSTRDYYGAIDWSVVYPGLYSGSEAPTLEVDDFFTDVQTLASITVTDYLNSTAYTPTRAWPYNAASKGDAFTRLEFANTVLLPSGPGGLIVTAKWGWAAVPSTIKNARLLQASRYYERRTSPMGVAGFGAMGTAIRLQARLDPDVDQMVNDYTRHWAAA